MDKKKLSKACKHLEEILLQKNEELQKTKEATAELKQVLLKIG